MARSQAPPQSANCVPRFRDRGVSAVRSQSSAVRSLYSVHGWTHHGPLEKSSHEARTTVTIADNPKDFLAQSNGVCSLLPDLKVPPIGRRGRADKSAKTNTKVTRERRSRKVNCQRIHKSWIIGKNGPEINENPNCKHSQ